MYYAELNVIPYGLSKSYSEHIDFNILLLRIIKLEKDLFDIINGNISNYYQFQYIKILDMGSVLGK